MSLFSNQFKEKEWNQFFTFGFKCTREYLANGLHESKDKNYQLKALAREIEGVGEDADGLVFSWIVEYCGNAVKNHKAGQSEDDIYKLFSEQRAEYCDIWNQKRLIDGLWQFCEGRTNSYEYNSHKKGKTKSDKRDLKGPKGKQRPHITITESRKQSH